ncbi:Plasmodium vivax Vir protein, putative [Plasmodium vivax]|uniref:Vir protein, putative n=1 Tax=Plasmodium vivax TaxID=5855 RepID=A0A1G4E5R5_PLAVI|nr:Plasmodium vivax Vir protein, putative [Plasmodium vivax]
MFDKKENFWKEFDGLTLPSSVQLNSEYFYNKLNDVENFSEYNEYCESLAHNPRGNAIKNICIKLLNYLKTNKISNKPNDQYNVCTLLNYWVYDRLNLVLYSYNSDNSNYINRKFGEIVGIWNSFLIEKLKKPDDETCVPDSRIVVYNDWKKRQQLYEYYVDYYPIKQSLEPYPQLCKEFYQYVESKIPLYTHFKEHCPDTDTKKCPEFYKQCEPYNPENVLHTLSCQNQILQERASDKSRGQQIGNGHSVSETEPRGTSVDMVSVGSSQKSSGKSHTADNVGNILLGVVATTMTSGALYRFTPLGGMIRNGLGWNNNNMRNFNGGDIRLYDYASEPFNPYPGEEHYIGYHPA